MNAELTQEHATAPHEAAEHVDTLHAAAEGHAEGHAEAHAEAHKDVFTELVGELKNGQEWAFEPFGTWHLPYIFYDTDGLHAYGSEHALEEGKIYTMKDEKPVRLDNGHAPSLDLSISRAVVLMWVVGAVLFVLLSRAARRYRKSLVPSGAANVFEALVVFVRDEIVAPTSGEVGVRMLPFFLTVFFFILFCNLFGLIPFGHSATGNVSVTAGLAAIAFVLVQATHIRENGLGGYLKHLTGGTHWLMWPIMVPVEFLGLFTKPFALCIRLFANMTAGHVVILSLIGLIFFFKTVLVAPLSIGFSLFISVLELLVAVIQAYVFTMLTSLFVGLGLPHGHGDEHGHEHA